MTLGGADTSATEKPLPYQGRKTSRAKSEHRRRVILEAALRIVIREGVRGIRHRAVAKEADVPLAATTYYFKDIQELIVDTFTLYTEKALSVVNRFTDQFYQPLQNLAGGDMESLAADGEISDEALENILNYLVQQLTQYLREQIGEARDMLVAEQAFRYESIVNQRISELALLHRRVLFDKIEAFMRLVSSPAPKEDAEIVLGLFHSLEYSALLMGPGQEDFGHISATLKRHLSLVIPDLLRRQG
jgi:DNA-binding transcriptional regulator YbjK